MSNQEKQIYAFILAATIVVSIVVGGLAGFLAAQSVTKSQSFFNGINNLINNEKVVAEAEADPVVKVVEQASPAVVSIIVTKDLPKINQGQMPDIFRQFFGDNLGDLLPPESNEIEKQEIGGGSGFIISADGLIVTNKHVVADEEADYTVLLNDGNKYPAKVLARDPLNDLAIIKIEAKDLSTLEFGDSGSIKVGQKVIAIGNALGEFRNTVSTGVVSGLARSITASSGLFTSEQLVGLIQTDASINPGNSGGPLLNIAGQVIGINVAIAQGAQNVGFAIPIDQVKNTIESVKKDGRLIRAFLGVRYVIITPELAKTNSLNYDYGALILRGEKLGELAITPGSPADKAGLKENSIILEVDGKKIDKDNPLAPIVAKHKPGDVIKLKVSEAGKEKNISVTLEESK